VKKLWPALAAALCIGLAAMLLAPAKPVSVPVLLYHAFCPEDSGVISESWVSAGRLEEQLAALKEAGYRSVTLGDLMAGKKLPKKPLVITADDGYLDNLTVAAPIFEKYGFTLSVAVIGVSAGKDTYKETGTPIIPHFSLEEARPWVEKGVIELFSHTYDLHQGDLDGPDHRHSVTRLEGETDEAYRTALETDFRRSLEQLAELGVPALAYPHGEYGEIPEAAAASAGFRLTMTTETGTNFLTSGSAEGLTLLRRNMVTQGQTGEALVKLLDNMAAQ